MAMLYFADGRSDVEGGRYDSIHTGASQQPLLLPYLPYPLISIHLCVRVCGSSRDARFAALQERFHELYGEVAQEQQAEPQRFGHATSSPEQVTHLLHTSLPHALTLASAQAFARRSKSAMTHYALFCAFSSFSSSYCMLSLI
jgi:hypothetical protein